jgi:hypothetical protein
MADSHISLERCQQPAIQACTFHRSGQKQTAVFQLCEGGLFNG